MLLPFNVEIFFYRKPIDFRKQIDGLMILIADQLECDPTSGQIFIFRNKGNDRLKVLYYERNGFWLLYRRLESGSFKFPTTEDMVMGLSVDQFQWLLSGLDVMQYSSRSSSQYSHFY